MENNTEYTIRSVRAVEGGARLLIELVSGEEREWLSLLAARLDRLPQKGPVSPETVSELRGEAAVCAAMAAGLRALSRAGSSRRHLTQKLRAAGHGASAVQEAVKELASKGYLCEEEGAVREAEKGLAKLWGDRRIMADLKCKGYSGGALSYAAARLRDEDSVARCAALMRKRRIRLSADEQENGKSIASLMRYGYTAPEIREAFYMMSKH